MKEIRYVLLDPTGNLTVLAESDVPPEAQPAVAGQIMKKEPAAEQVGFVSAEPDGIALRMAGGEFCGNAAMSAAVLFAVDHGITDGWIRVTVSGTPAPVEVAVCAADNGRMRGTVAMPRPVSIGEEELPGGGPRTVVRFDGIAHVILETPLPRERAETLAPLWCRHLGAESLGILTFDRPAGTLLPLVYVPAADTLCWEHSCASGTTAVGAFLAAGEGPGSWTLRQPGGILTVEADPAGRLFLTGYVRLCARRSIRIAE